MSSPAVCVHVPEFPDPVPAPIPFVSFQFSAVFAPFPFFSSVPGFPVSVLYMRMRIEESLNYPTIVKITKKTKPNMVKF